MVRIDSARSGPVAAAPASSTAQTFPAARRWLPRLVPLAYLAAALYLSGPFLSHPTRAVPGGPDGTVYTWFFEWARYSVVHGLNPLESDWMNAPAGLNSMWNGSLLVVALLFVPVTAAVGPTASVGIVIMLAPALSATAAYLAFRVITRRAAASALAAAPYGFGPFFIGQNIHVHLTLAVFPPLLLMVAHQLFVRQDRSAVRWGVGLGVLVALSILTTEELVALTAVIAVVATVVLVLLNPRAVRARFAHAATGLGVGIAVALLIAGFPLAWQFFGPESLPAGVGIHNLRVDLDALVRPGALQYYASPADIVANEHFPANPAENTGYLGWPLLVLCAVICCWLLVRRERMALWWLLTTAVTVAFSFGTEISVRGRDIGRQGPWTFLDGLPVLSGAIPVRFSLLTTLLVALLLAWGLARLRGAALAVGLIVTAAALVPLRPAHRFDEISPVPTPAFFTTSAVQAIPAGATALLLPRGSSSLGEEPPMVWQLQSHLRFKIIGGYGVFSDNGTLSYTAQLPDFARLLQVVGDTGRRPTAAELATATVSIAPSDAHYIVITRAQVNGSLVADTAAELTGCTPRAVADVLLCSFPTGP